MEASQSVTPLFGTLEALLCFSDRSLNLKHLRGLLRLKET